MRNPLHVPDPPAGATRRRPQRGTIIVWLAAFLMVLLGVTSVGIDMAKVMATRTQLQNAADAAALAGASAIDPATGLLIEAQAVARAQELSGHNEAFVEGSEPVVLDAADVQIIDADKVRVTVRRQGATSVLTHFARLFGIDALGVTADATAKVEPAGAVNCGLVPLAGVPLPNEAFQVGCSPGYVLKLGGGSGLNGNYYGLRFPPCNSGPCSGMNPPGANTYECLLEGGYCCPVAIGQELTTETGNISGPTRHAIEARFENDTDAREGICHADYTGNGQRVIYVPVTTPPTGGGSEIVTVTGFAAFFVKRIPGSGQNSVIEGEFLNAVVPAAGGGVVADANLFAIRLIE